MHLLPGYIEKQNEIVEKTYFHPLCSCNSISDCSEAHKKIIANVVQRDCVKDETYAAVDYMINELWDNAGVHGYECYDAERYPKPVYICALEYNDCYEICIGDRGQGIFESLRKNNDKLSSKNKKVAIQSAIKTAFLVTQTGALVLDYTQRLNSLEKPTEGFIYGALGAILSFLEKTTRYTVVITAEGQ